LLLKAEAGRPVEKKSLSTITESKPGTGPQSKPNTQVAIIRYVARSEELRLAAPPTDSGLLSIRFVILGLYGIGLGVWSWKPTSYPTITVTGAVIVFSTLATTGPTSSRKSS